MLVRPLGRPGPAREGFGGLAKPANRPRQNSLECSPDQAITLTDPGRQDQDGGGIGLALADAGYCSEANLTCAGPDRLIATGKRRDLEQAARDPDSDGPDRGGRWRAGSRQPPASPWMSLSTRKRGL